jgi:hypothetical protein
MCKKFIKHLLTKDKEAIREYFHYVAYIWCTLAEYKLLIESGDTGEIFNTRFVEFLNSPNTNIPYSLDATTGKFLKDEILPAIICTYIRLRFDRGISPENFKPYHFLPAIMTLSFHLFFHEKIQGEKMQDLIKPAIFQLIPEYYIWLTGTITERMKKARLDSPPYATKIFLSAKTKLLTNWADYINMIELKTLQALIQKCRMNLISSDTVMSANDFIALMTMVKLISMQRT